MDHNSSLSHLQLTYSSWTNLNSSFQIWRSVWNTTLGIVGVQTSHRLRPFYSAKVLGLDKPTKGSNPPDTRVPLRPVSFREDSRVPTPGESEGREGWVDPTTSFIPRVYPENREGRGTGWCSDTSKTFCWDWRRVVDLCLRENNNLQSSSRPGKKRPPRPFLRKPGRRTVC